MKLQDMKMQVMKMTEQKLKNDDRAWSGGRKKYSFNRDNTTMNNCANFETHNTVLHFAYVIISEKRQKCCKI